MGKNSVFNKCYRVNWVATCRRVKLDPYLTPYTKRNSKWIKDLSVRAKTIELLEEHINIYGLGLGNRFLDMTPKV